LLAHLYLSRDKITLLNLIKLIMFLVGFLDEDPFKGIRRFEMSNFSLFNIHHTDYNIMLNIFLIHLLDKSLPKVGKKGTWTASYSFFLSICCLSLLLEQSQRHPFCSFKNCNWTCFEQWLSVFDIRVCNKVWEPFLFR